VLSLDRDGAEHHEGAAKHLLADLSDLLSKHDRGEPGRRLFGCPALTNHVATGSSINQLVNQLAGAEARPVRAILFDKNPQCNWPLGWHQDRVIAVRNRAQVAGFGPWTVKRGVQHVAPPPLLLERMITVRIHLDKVDQANAPLLVAPGSHLLGLVPERSVDTVVERCGTHACLAEAGDLWCYRTLILHASAPPRRRDGGGFFRSTTRLTSCREVLNGLDWETE
jgi:hypothetical protein